MTTLKGRPVVGGHASGPALVTRVPINFTASFTKPPNLLKGRRSQIQDRHHELFKRHIKGTVLIFPAAIGSTYTGMVLLELIFQKNAPSAIIVAHADSLLVSGPILAEVWFGKGIPMVEYGSDDIFVKISYGTKVSVDGDTGEITIF